MTPTIEDLVTLDLGVGMVTGAERNTGVRDPGQRLWPLRGSRHAAIVGEDNRPICSGSSVGGGGS